MKVDPVMFAPGRAMLCTRPVATASPLIATPLRSEDGVPIQLALASAPGGGLIVMPDAFTNTHSARNHRLTAQHRLPTIYAYRFQAAAYRGAAPDY